MRWLKWKSGTGHRPIPRLLELEDVPVLFALSEGEDRGAGGGFEVGGGDAVGGV